MSTAAPEAPVGKPPSEANRPPTPEPHESRFRGTFGKYTNGESVTQEEKVDPAQSTEKEAPKDAPKPSPSKEENNKVLREKLENETKALKEFQEKATTLESRVTELQEKADAGEATKKELAELRSKYEEREKLFEYQDTQIAALNLMGSTRYQNEIQKPLDEAYKAVYEIADAHKLDANVFQNALWEPDRAKRSQMMEELIADLPQMDKEELVSAHRKIRELGQRGEQLQKNAKEAWDAHQLQDKADKEKQTAKSKETYKSIFGNVKSEMAKKHDSALVEEAAKEAALVDFDTMSPDAKAFAVLAMYLGPAEKTSLQAQLTEKDAKIKELEATIAKRNDRPGPSGAPANQPRVNSNERPKAFSQDDKEKLYGGMFGGRR